ncbi:MAG TPA: GntR family transcriptional regulator [Nocardioidaceae bacterium]|nr:GntR family transcriptional regulator [Nocardioidaceae bacterium]
MRYTTEPHPGSAAQKAYDFIKWAILNSVYAGGQLLTEGALAEEVGVSRTPVREALLRLEVEGLLTLLPKRGALVATYSGQDVDDVLDARWLVEMHTAAKSFAHRLELLPVIEAVHERMKRNRREHDTAGFTASDREFHEAIVDAAGNAVLSAVYRMLRERQTLFTSVMMRGRVDRMDEAIAEHDRIIAALRGNDAVWFESVVTDHLAWSIDLARQML